MQFIFDGDGACRKIMYRIEEQDRFDAFSYEMLRENAVQGLLAPMRAERNGMDTVQYDVSHLDSLKDYLRFSLSVRQLLSVFSQIISTVGALENYLLDSSLLVTDIGQIYYDREHDTVKMIYFLLFGGTCHEKFEEKLLNLFKEIIFSARFITGDGDRYIAELLNGINDAKDFRVAEFKEVVSRLEGILSENPAQAGKVYEDCRMVSDISVEYEVGGTCADRSFPVSDSGDIIYGYGTGGADRAEPGVFNFVKRLIAKAVNKWDDCAEPGSDAADADSDEAILCGTARDEVRDSETEVLVRGSMGSHTPYLIRSSNSERIAVNKRTFKIGKDVRYADYVIADNAAVSRAHAEFTIRDGKIYVMDEDSLNNTYINGNALAGRKEYEVNEGDVIMFADEEFVLHC